MYCGAKINASDAFSRKSTESGTNILTLSPSNTPTGPTLNGLVNTSQDRGKLLEPSIQTAVI